jgi:hypothetical protein
MADITESDSDSEREPGPMEAAVLADLERWGPKLAAGILAVGALDMARRLDTEKMNPTPASLLHAQLRTSAIELERLAPEQEETDEIDEITGDHERRHGMRSV